MTEKSLRNRIVVCHALCSVAEDRVRLGELERATEIICTIRAIRDTVLSIPAFLSPSDEGPAVREARELTADLDRRIRAMEDRLSHDKPSRSA